MAVRKRVHASADGLQFLLEMMIAYGVQYKDYQDVQLQGRALKAEERGTYAERLDREKAEILGTIAHESRTPITAALGNVDFAANSFDRGHFESVPTYRGSAKSSAAPHLRPIEALQLCHQALRATRGAAVTIAEIDAESIDCHMPV